MTIGNGFMTRLTLAIAMLVALVGCGGGDADPNLLNIRQPRSEGPDEFAVLPTKPLEMPADRSLPPPTPGGTNRTDPTPQADATAALGGNATVLNRPSGDGALIAYTGRHGRNPQIREQLAAADLEFRRLAVREPEFADQVASLDPGLRKVAGLGLRHARGLAAADGDLHRAVAILLGRLHLGDPVRLRLDHGYGNRIPVVRKDARHAALAANDSHRHSQNLTPTSIGRRLFANTQTHERASHRQERRVRCALGLTLRSDPHPVRFGGSGICRVAFDFPATDACLRHPDHPVRYPSWAGRLPARPTPASPQLYR